MKITTRISIGYGLMVAAIVGSIWLPLSRSTVGWIALALGVLLSFLLTLFVGQILRDQIRLVRRKISELLNENNSKESHPMLAVNEFADLAEDLSALEQKWKESRSVKKRFFSHASHELKSPLAGMQESIQMLMDPSHGPLTSTQKRLFEIHLRSCKRLNALISNLVDLHLLEEGMLPLTLKNEELRDLIQASARECYTQDRPVDIRVELPAYPLWVECDGPRICQAIKHLLTNAVKFAPPNSVIRIKAEFLPGLPPEFLQRYLTEGLKAEKGVIRLSITDSGPGVPDADKVKIFESFQQGEGIKYQKGIGLGLAFCRAVVLAHCGSVWVEDNPSGGSIFSFVLPAAEMMATQHDDLLSHQATIS